MWVQRNGGVRRGPLWIARELTTHRYQPRLIVRATGLLTTRVVVALGQLQRAQVAAAVAAHARGASIARVSSSTIVPTACNGGLRSGPMRDNRYQPQLNELLGCSPRVVVALGQLQPKWQQL